MRDKVQAVGFSVKFINLSNLGYKEVCSKRNFADATWAQGPTGTVATQKGHLNVLGRPGGFPARRVSASTRKREPLMNCGRAQFRKVRHEVGAKARELAGPAAVQGTYFSGVGAGVREQK